jgi:signal peptidase I
MTDAVSAPVARKPRFWRNEWVTFALFLLLLGGARTTLANHYQVPSGSMQPNLQPGDRIAVNMLAYGLRVPFTDIELIDRGEPQRGDVVVFKSPADGTRLIKRVVAVGGDTVALADGRLWIDGVPLYDANATDIEHFGARDVRLDLRHGGGPDIPEIEIPPGMALVLGDHRGNSADGRFFGLVPLKSLYGRAEAVYWRTGEGLGWTRL